MRRTMLIFAASMLMLLFLQTVALAAQGDLYAPGTTYWATTYSGHSNYHLWPDTTKSHIADIVAARNPAGEELGNSGNYRLPIHAPGVGTVEQVSQGYGGGWGNSIIWTSADGREEIHLAHLDSVVKTGRVEAGEVIGREGSTGFSTLSNFNHLHISRRLDGQVAPVVLSGVAVEPYSYALPRDTQPVYIATTAEQTIMPREAAAKEAAEQEIIRQLILLYIAGPLPAEDLLQLGPRG